MSLTALAFSLVVIFAGGAVAVLIDAYRHPTKPVPPLDVNPPWEGM